MNLAKIATAFGSVLYNHTLRHWHHPSSLQDATAFTTASRMAASSGPYLEPALGGLEYPAFAYAFADHPEDPSKSYCAALVVHKDILLASPACEGVFFGASHVVIHGDDDTSHHLVLSEHVLLLDKPEEERLLIVVLAAPTSAQVAPLLLNEEAKWQSDAGLQPPPNVTLLGMLPDDGARLFYKAVSKTIPCPVNTKAEEHRPTNDKNSNRTTSVHWCMEATPCSLATGPVIMENSNNEYYDDAQITLAAFVRECQPSYVRAVPVNATQIWLGICRYSSYPPLNCPGPMNTLDYTANCQKADPLETTNNHSQQQQIFYLHQTT